MPTRTRLIPDNKNIDFLQSLLECFETFTSWDFSSPTIDQEITSVGKVEAFGKGQVKETVERLNRKRWQSSFVGGLNLWMKRKETSFYCASDDILILKEKTQNIALSWKLCHETWCFKLSIYIAKAFHQKVIEFAKQISLS